MGDDVCLLVNAGDFSANHCICREMAERLEEQTQKSSEQISKDNENHSRAHLSLHNTGGIFVGDLMKEMPFESFSESETLEERESCKQKSIAEMKKVPQNLRDQKRV